MLARLLTHPLAPLAALSLASAPVYAAYIIYIGALTPAAEWIFGWCWSLMLIAWVGADARRRRGLPWFDFRLLLCALLPLSIAYYCFWSRGWRGLGVLAGLIALAFVPGIVAGFVEIALYAWQ